MSSRARRTAHRDASFDDLWHVAHTAFDEGDLETACHTLQAALARARFVYDAERVAAVGEAAKSQHDLLFEQTPDGFTPAWQELPPFKREAIKAVYESIIGQVPGIMAILQIGH